MAESETSTNSDTKPIATGLRDKIAALVHWTRESRIRMGLVGGLLVVLLGGMFAAWSYLAHLAVRSEDPITLANALESLDRGDYEEAKSLVGQIQSQGDETTDVGGVLFVLGTVKAYLADTEWTTDRQRAMHLVAARYLRKARSLGVPQDRERQSQFLLGRSLIYANQPRSGIAELTKLLDNEGTHTVEIHALLSDAYLTLPDPDLESALQHNRYLLGDQKLEGERRDQAILDRAEMLVRLGRLDEAAQQLKVPLQSTDKSARAKNLGGQWKLQSALSMPVADTRRVPLIDQAISDFEQSTQLDPLRGVTTRRALYWIGKSYEAKGDLASATAQYDTLSQLYGDTPEGLVGVLAKAQLLQSSGKAEQALNEFRHVLDSVGQPAAYANPLLSLSALRQKLLSAHMRFVDARQFEHAIALVELFPPTFKKEEVTELRGGVYKKWGLLELIATEEDGVSNNDAHKKRGRYHLRAAGQAYDQLAKMRFATRYYTEDLWEAAELYFKGHSFSNAARMLEEYLRHEATRHKAMALLRIGQCQLALGKTKQAISALDECIEIHPRDPAVYQARLECASAYLQLGDREKARQLLITNLTGDTMTPKSIQWRDSLFALGDLLHNAGDYDQAIAALDEAVDRASQTSQAPQSSQTLFARYTIARSFHRAADEPAQKAQEAKTESERQKNRQLRDEKLEAALQHYLSVQHLITLEDRSDDGALERALLRNCYMMQGSVLFQLRRYQEARKAFAAVSGLYQEEPFVLESFVHTANCWRRLNQPVNSRQTIEQAKLVLSRFPEETDFTQTTNFSRQQWQFLLDEMARW